MKSNKYLFNKTIFISDIKRFFPFSVLLLIAQLIIFPVALLSQLLSNVIIETYDFAVISSVSSGTTFVFAAVMALLTFSYLYSPNKCNAFHAFPIGRKSLFATNFAAGYLMLVIPQIIGFAASIPIIISNGNIKQMLLVQSFAIFGESFVYYSIAVLAVMLAGNIFSGGAIYLIMNFAYTAVQVSFGFTVLLIGRGLSAEQLVKNLRSYFSPVVKMFSTKLNNMYTLAAYSEKEYLLSVGIYVLVSLVLVAASYLLYKKRQLECAGDMVVYEVEKPVISVLLSVIGGALASILFAYIFDNFTAVRLITYVLFSFLFFFAAQMVLNKSAAVFKPKQFIIWSAACVLSVALTFAVANYETNYIPATSSVKSCSIQCTYDIDVDSKKDIETVEQTHQSLIDAIKDESHGTNDLFFYDSYDSNTISVKYTLRNGREVIRAYHLGHKYDDIITNITELERKYPPETCIETLENIDFSIRSCEITKYGGEFDLSYKFKKGELKSFYSEFAAASKNFASSYTSAKYPEGTEFGDYEVTFECECKNEEEAKKLIELCNSDMYYDDIAGISINPDGTYEYNGKYDYYQFNKKTFSITASLPQDSELIEYINANYKLSY
ncbi:MAG: ABC transporter permease [Ruminococcaceae bacterium]|nr:ABC transporter permease [Oscillospiraceae bacterium]